MPAEHKSPSPTPAIGEGDTSPGAAPALGIRRFDLALLAPLDALLEERNVTRAAERLCVTQPTMSGILRRLREHFDDPLLVRDGRALALSPLGASLVEPVRQALLQIDATLAVRPDFDPATARRRFRLMASDYAIATFLAPALKAIAREAPGLGFTVEPMEAPAERVRDGTVDACVTGNPRFGPGDGARTDRARADRALRVETLFDERYLCIVDRDHPLDGTVTLARFRDFPHVTAQFLDARGAPGTRPARSLPLVAEPHAAPVTRVPGFLPIPGLVAGGEAIGIVPARLWAGLAGRGDLRALDVDFAIPGFTERLLWHERLALDPGFAWLRARLHEVARSLPGPGSRA